MPGTCPLMSPAVRFVAAAHAAVPRPLAHFSGREGARGRTRAPHDITGRRRGTATAAGSGDGQEQPAAEFQCEAEVKKSRFIATVVPTTDDGMSVVAAVKERYADARHNCFALVTQAGAKRFSDDGEPGGTAGKPILSAIESSGLVNVAVVVTRYYGGIKLGTGGLARAYGGAAASALAGVPRETIRVMTTLVVEVPFDDIGTLYRNAESHDACVGDVNGEHDNTAVTAVTIPLASVSAFQAALKESTAGRARCSLAEQVAAR